MTDRITPQTNPGLHAALLATEQDDPACCTYWIRVHPKHALSRFRHRLWVCNCGQAWRTFRGPYERATWLWRKWSQS